MEKKRGLYQPVGNYENENKQIFRQEPLPSRPRCSEKKNIKKQTKTKSKF